MKKSEVATILAKISAYDRRTIGEADVEAWHEALDGKVTVVDALTAVRDHFRVSKEWLMPCDIIKLGREARIARVRAAGSPDIPADLTAAQERQWLRKYWDVLNSYGDGDVGRAVMWANRDLGITHEDVASHMLPPEEVKAKIAAFGASMKSISA